MKKRKYDIIMTFNTSLEMRNKLLELADKNEQSRSETIRQIIQPYLDSLATKGKE